MKILSRQNFNPLPLFKNSKTGIDLQGKSDRPKKDWIITNDTCHDLQFKQVHAIFPLRLLKSQIFTFFYLP